MAEVRHSIDQLDRELVTLLAERFRFMDAAARIKPQRNQVRDEARKQQVIRNAGKWAESLGLGADLVEHLWDVLVESSIAYELNSWDQIRTDARESGQTA